MFRKFALAGATLATVVGLTNAAFAGAADYAFEPVKADIKKGEEVTVAVRELTLYDHAVSGTRAPSTVTAVGAVALDSRRVYARAVTVSPA